MTLKDFCFFLTATDSFSLREEPRTNHEESVRLGNARQRDRSATPARSPSRIREPTFGRKLYQSSE